MIEVIQKIASLSRISNVVNWWTSLCYQRPEAVVLLRILQYDLSFSLQIIFFYLHLLFRIIHPEIRTTKTKDYCWDETAFILPFLRTNSCTHPNRPPSPYVLSRERNGFSGGMILSTRLRFLLKRLWAGASTSLLGLWQGSQFLTHPHSLLAQHAFSRGHGMRGATL